MLFGIKRIMVLGLACLVSLCALEGEAAAGERFVLGVCVMGTRHPYFRDMLDELQKLATQNDMEIVAGDADFNHEKQVDLIEGYIQRKVSMILVAPFDAKRLNPTLVKAGRAGIPVMTIDAASDGYDVVSHCASDNAAGGRLAAGLLLETLSHSRNRRAGTVLVFDHDGVTSTFQRVKGFRDVMALRGRDYSPVVIDAVGQTDFAAEKTQAALVARGDDVVAVFASNDGMTMGALQAVEEAGKLSSIVIVGYDYVEEAKRAVDEGKIVGIVVQFPRRIADAAFKIAHDYITGKDRRPEKEVLVEVGTYTREGFLDQRGNPIDG